MVYCLIPEGKIYEYFVSFPLRLLTVQYRVWLSLVVVVVVVVVVVLVVVVVVEVVVITIIISLI